MSRRTIRNVCCSALLVALVSGAPPLMRPSIASCGLEGCPALPGGSMATHKYSLHAMLREVSFDIDDITGDYSMLTLRLETTAAGQVQLGGFVPLVSLRTDESDSLGMANPVLFAEWRAVQQVNRSLVIGNQLELPIGDSEDGIAADHFEVLPYAGYRQSFGELSASANVGFRFALGEHSAHEEGDHHAKPSTRSAHGGETPILVNPHEDQEFLYRVGVSRDFGSKPIRPELFLDGQLVMKGEDPGQNFLTAGALVSIPAGGRYQLQPTLEFPLTEESRFEWRLGMGFTARF